MTGRADHWAHVWATREPTDLSWYQAEPTTSLRLVRAVTAACDAVIDVGSGASSLPLALVRSGYTDVTALDVSERALTTLRADDSADDSADDIRRIVADVTRWSPDRAYRCWHDRAAYHFLVDDADRCAYVDVAARAVGAGGHVVVATFALDGPDRCSDLPVRRCDAAQLADDFARHFELVDAVEEHHRTPWGAEQHFQYATLRRR